MTAEIEQIKICHTGKEVTANKLTVATILPIALDTAWAKVQTSALLEFVAKGMVAFLPTGGKFPEKWKEGAVVTTKMRVYGFIPFGGQHTLRFEKIDGERKILQTSEWDSTAQVWNHKISMKKISDNEIYYEDEVIIYAGMLTPLISFWAKLFYKHRQRRWQLLANKLIAE